MWQLSWMFSLLPDWIWHLILIASMLGLVIAQFIKFIPFINEYKFPIQIVSVLLLLLSMWMEGSISNEEKWQARVKELEAKVAVSEAKSAEANVQIQTVVVEKIVETKKRGKKIVKYINRVVTKDKEVVKFVENCPIPQIIVKTHNAAALNKPVDEEKKK